MLRRKVQIDPAQLGRVQFSWRVASLIEQADLSDADASDSPVRLVFAFDGDHRRLSARNRMLFDLAQVLTGEPPPYATLMYVWDNRAAAGIVIHGPRTDRVRKIVLESGPGQCGRWLHYERDLSADFRQAFGEEPGRADRRRPDDRRRQHRESRPRASTARCGCSAATARRCESAMIRAFPLGAGHAIC